MKMVLESLASSNDEKVPRDLADGRRRGRDGSDCDILCLSFTGTEDKRAGGISQQVPECSGAGQRSEPDDSSFIVSYKHTSALLYLTKQTFSEKLQEGDYDDIADDPSLPASSEVTALVEESGRSSGEVNTAGVQAALTQDGPQTS